MRIGTELTEETSEKVQKLADELGWQKSKAYTELIRTGLDIQKRRETIKQYIVDFFEEQKPRHEERMADLKSQHGIEEVEWMDTKMQVTYNGNEYSFPGGRPDLSMVNGQDYEKNICPNCGSDEINLENDDYRYSCGECGERFDRPDKEYRVPQEDLENVKEFAGKRDEIYTHVQNKLDEILDQTMGWYEGHGEWLHQATYSYQNGFQQVTIPFWATDKERIRFNVSSNISSYSDIRNPLYRAAKNSFTEDYLELVQEIQAANSSADRIEPIYIDRRETQPEIIEVIGLEYSETKLPYRTVGYEVEKVEPEPEDLRPEHDEDTDVTWIKVTNDKRIELPQSYEDSEEYYLAISDDDSNFTPVHIIDRETHEPECGEDLEEISTDSPRLKEDEPVARKSVCNGCLDEVEDF